MGTKFEVQSLVMRELPTFGMPLRLAIFLLAVISYVDRTCISVSGPFLAADLGLSSVQMGFVYGAFIFRTDFLPCRADCWATKSAERKVITGARPVVLAVYGIDGSGARAVESGAGAVSVRSRRIERGPNSSKVIAKWLPPSQMGIWRREACG